MALTLPRFLPLAGLLAGLALSPAACGEDEGGAMGCVPQLSIACTCFDGSMGAQVCLPDGTGYGLCMCTGSDGTGDGGSGSGSTAGGDAGDTADGTAGNPCGNGVTDPGECDPDDAAFCAQDCGVATGGSSDGAGSCDGQPVFALMVPGVTSAWASGALTGLAAGDAMCVAAGADHVCDYEELEIAAAANEFAAVPAATTAWLHRTVPVVDELGANLAPGTGGRCIDWTYADNLTADGEFVTFNGGVPTYTFDDDTLFNAAAPEPNPHVQVGLLECGGVTRSIACCHPPCMP